MHKLDHEFSELRIIHFGCVRHGKTCKKLYKILKVVMMGLCQEHTILNGLRGSKKIQKIRMEVNDMDHNVLWHMNASVGERIHSDWWKNVCQIDGRTFERIKGNYDKF